MRDFISIIVSVDQLKYTKKCVESIRKYTPEFHEMIFVINGFKAGKVKWIKELINKNRNYRLIKGNENVPLIKSCNDAIRTASGNHIVLIKDHVVVADGWLSGMLECINSAPAAGIVGPMTNNSNGAQNVIDADYGSIDRLEEYAGTFRQRNRHRYVPSRVIGGFCMLFKRDLVEKIGLLDESFRAGSFEDKDFCLRAALEGHRNLIAGDVFVHQYGSKSFVENGTNYDSTKSNDKKLFAEKWSGIDAQSPLGKKLLTLNIMEKAGELYQKGEIGNAVDMLLKGIGHCPDDERLYHTLSKILIDAKQFKDALDVLNEMKPDNQDVKRLELTGYCKEGMELHEEAEECADRVLSLNSGSASTLNLKGILAYKRGEEREAKTFFNRAIESDQGYGEPYTNLGTLKWDLGQEEEALNLFERGFILSPTVTGIITTYHSAIASLGEFRRAEPVFREANALHPHNERLKLLLIDIFIQQGKYDAAMKEIEDVMVAFAIDDGFISAALRVRDILGLKEINKTSGEKGTVSLCMIVKNEEEDLAKCLRSVKPVVDEMIVVDTGSTDRTRDIARVFGAKVYDFKWTDDFSEARNFSISKASGNWIFLLDADEVISSLDYGYFRAIVRKSSSKPGAYSFVTRNYMTRANTVGWIANDGRYDLEEAADGWIPSFKVRLFQNESHIRFEYPVHEMVEPSLVRGGIAVMKSNMPIHHYGKLNKEKSDCKGEAYYHIGRKKLDEMGHDAVAVRELAIQAGLLKKWEEAIELWQRLIGIQPKTPEAFVNMGTAYWHLGKYDQALSAAKRAIELAPHMNESSYNYAICELHLGNAGQAISVLEDLLDRSPGYLPAQFMLTAAYCCDGKREKGLEGFEKLGKTNMGPGLAISCHELAKGLISAQRIEYAILLLDAAMESKNINKDVLALFSECLEMRKCAA
ncbi:MAG: glycosyltransferase [Deltaproteobacteria bacterium]|nr:glycosyltransferase [Deltaproteobacteria bacterium]